MAKNFVTSLEGKVALVTGSTRGIGLAIAVKLKQAGCIVVLNGRCTKNLADAVDIVGADYSIKADVTVNEDAKSLVSDVVSRAGSLDILVCNVGSGTSVPPGQETLDEWQRVFAINFFSATNCVEAAKKYLEMSSGKVICISSICGIECVPGAPITYSVAKSALNAYVKNIARPLGRKGISISSIAPGNILFEGSVWDRKFKEDPLAVEEMLGRDVASGALGSPDDVADLVLYLARQETRFATGSVWTLDGGQTRS